jgi:signal transduction histidine kinase
MMRKASARRPGGHSPGARSPGRAWPTWVFLVLAVVVMLVGAAGVEVLVRSADAAKRAEVLVWTLAADASDARSYTGMAVDRGELSGALHVQLTIARAGTTAAGNELGRASDAPETRSLLAALTPFQDAVSATVANLKADRLDQATILDRSRVGPSFTKLERAIGPATTALHRRASSAETIADADVPITLLLVVSIGSLMVMRAIGNRDLTERIETERASRARTERVRRELLARTVMAAEEERTRLAAELHDGPVQRLTSVDYLLQRMRGRLDKGQIEDASGFSAKAQDTIRAEITALRRIMTDLRPPVLDQRGLVEALREYAGRLGPAAGIECTVDSRLEDRLAPASETVLYRVAQEALQNVYKHSKARSAKISLRQSEGWVRLEVQDDGVGYESAAGPDADGRHLGLLGMRERVEMVGGRWNVFSRPGHGTRVAAILPKEPVSP